VSGVRGGGKGVGGVGTGRKKQLVNVVKSDIKERLIRGKRLKKNELT